VLRELFVAVFALFAGLYQVSSGGIRSLQCIVWEVFVIRYTRTLPMPAQGVCYTLIH